MMRAGEGRYNLSHEGEEMSSRSSDGSSSSDAAPHEHLVLWHSRKPEKPEKKNWLRIRADHDRQFVRELSKITRIPKRLLQVEKEFCPTTDHRVLGLEVHPGAARSSEAEEELQQPPLWRVVDLRTRLLYRATRFAEGYTVHPGVREQAFLSDQLDDVVLRAGRSTSGASNFCSGEVSIAANTWRGILCATHDGLLRKGPTGVFGSCGTTGGDGAGDDSTGASASSSSAASSASSGGEEISPGGLGEGKMNLQLQFRNQMTPEEAEYDAELTYIVGLWFPDKESAVFANAGDLFGGAGAARTARRRTSSSRGRGSDGATTNQRRGSLPLLPSLAAPKSAVVRVVDPKGRKNFGKQQGMKARKKEASRRRKFDDDLEEELATSITKVDPTGWTLLGIACADCYPQLLTFILSRIPSFELLNVSVKVLKLTENINNAAQDDESVATRSCTPKANKSISNSPAALSTTTSTPAIAWSAPPLLIAVRHGETDEKSAVLVHLLVTTAGKDLDPNARDDRNYTALLLALKMQKYKTASTLLKHQRIDVNCVIDVPQKVRWVEVVTSSSCCPDLQDRTGGGGAQRALPQIAEEESANQESVPLWLSSSTPPAAAHHHRLYNQRTCSRVYLSQTWPFRFFAKRHKQLATDQAERVFFAELSAHPKLCPEQASDGSPGQNALHLACRCGNVAFVDLFLQNAAEKKIAGVINRIDDAANTAMAIAATFLSVQVKDGPFCRDSKNIAHEMTKLLLRVDCIDAGMPDKEGLSPMHKAEIRGYEKVARALLGWYRKKGVEWEIKREPKWEYSFIRGIGEYPWRAEYPGGVRDLWEVKDAWMEIRRKKASGKEDLLVDAPQ